jgi:hypothetical protein
MKNKISELDIDRAIANAIASSRDFQQWLLAHTKFSSCASDAILLINEAIALKPRKKPENWWRHWWCTIDEGAACETDIFLVFGFPDSDRRIALHVEDKPPHGKFTPDQPLYYKRRAAYMANKPQFMSYSEFATVLIAPNSFLEVNTDAVSHFDTCIAYESIAQHVPLISSVLTAQLPT